MSRPTLSKRKRLLLRWTIVSALVALLLSYAVFVAREPVATSPRDGNGAITGLTSVLARQATPDMVRFRLDDLAAAAGIEFRHFPGRRGSLLPEDMGSGLAWGDYDDDGDPDLLLVNFKGPIDPVEPERGDGRHALYRNHGDGTFSDVSAAAGLDRASYGLGAAWGDYDNDGDLDLYLTNFGPNLLYRNDGDGTFSEVGEPAGVAGTGFSAGCAWGDYDRDGFIDLYVSNYVEFVYRADDRQRTERQYGAEIPYTINPSAYPPAANRLYRNNGDGTFTDVAERAGVANPTGRSLVATWFDFDGDAWVDLYVANDVSENGVFLNRGDGSFADIGASSLAADYRGAMGLAVGDYDGDLDLDLFVTHWIAQENALFENMVSERLEDEEGRPRIFFMDTADLNGLGQASLRMVGWATGFVDFDNDALLDLWVVNGNTLERDDDPTRLRPQHLQIFSQQPSRGFFEVARQASEALAQPLVGRGGAHADYDGDGLMDLAVMVHGGRPLLLRNASPDPGNWLRLRLRQRGGNTRALAARVWVTTGDRVQTAQVGAGASYLSQNDTDLHFGLGAADRVDELTVQWPDGATERHQQVAARQVLVLTHRADYRR